METLELKTNLVHAIENLEDKKVLEEVYRLLQITIEDDIFKLSDVQKDKINIGKNQNREHRHAVVELFEHRTQDLSASATG